MKLLMIYGDPRIGGFGGVLEHSRNLISFLSHNRGLELNVLTYGDDNISFRDKSIKYRILKRFSSNIFLYLFIFPLDFLRLLMAAKKFKPDLIHFQGTHPLYCLAAIFLKRRYPIVITVHGILAIEMDFHHKNFLSKYFSKFVERFSLKRIDNIIVVAPQMKGIVEDMTRSKIFVISNGINLELIKNSITLKNPKTEYMLFLGSLISIKGVIVLLKALIKVKSVITELCLFLAGSGEDEDFLKEFVRDNGLEGNVKFLGFVESDLKYFYLKSSEFVILPSLWESLPISILEGMACGKPIIASDVGGIPYLIEDGFNGFLVKPGDVDDLANKIITLLNNKELRYEMGINSELKARNFDWRVIARKTVNLYQFLGGEYL